MEDDDNGNAELDRQATKAYFKIREKQMILSIVGSFQREGGMLSDIESMY